MAQDTLLACSTNMNKNTVNTKGATQWYRVKHIKHRLPKSTIEPEAPACKQDFQYRIFLQKQDP